MFKQTLLIGLLLVNACAFATVQTETQQAPANNQETTSPYANSSTSLRAEDRQEVKQETSAQGNDAQAQAEQKPASPFANSSTSLRAEDRQQEQTEQQAPATQAPAQEKELTEAEVEKLIADLIKQAQEEKAAQDAAKNKSAQDAQKK